jgi:solute:Na+ symporter, SSS family
MSVAIGLAVFVVAATAGGTIWLSVHGRRVDLSEWAVGGRSFGSVLLWFLSAGEIYTTFAFLGAAGWAYQYGAPGFYIIANAPLGYALGYWLLPRMWQAGHDHGVLSQGDYVHARFGERWLAMLISAIGILALIPYVQVQLTGLSAITQVLFAGAISKTLAVTGAAVVLLAFVFTAGIRSSAFASIVKDVMVIAVLVAVIATIGAATQVGGIGAIFHRMATEHPTYAVLPGMQSKAPYTGWWFISALVTTNVGYWMWPHAFQANLTARSKRAIRRNAVLQPLYTLSYFFIFVIGFAALLTLPKLRDSNQALVAFIVHSYPSWFVGLAAGAAMLVAVVPSTVMLLTIGTTFARTVYRPTAELSDRHRITVGRAATLVAVVVAALLTVHSNATIVSLLLVAYNGIAQIGPGMIASLTWRRTSAVGMAVGSVVGLAIVGVPAIGAWWKTISSVDVGLPALVVNTLLVVGVSLLTRAPQTNLVKVGIPESREPELAAEAG